MMYYWRQWIPNWHNNMMNSSDHILVNQWVPCDVVATSPISLSFLTNSMVHFNEATSSGCFNEISFIHSNDKASRQTLDASFKKTGMTHLILALEQTDDSLEETVTFLIELFKKIGETPCQLLLIGSSFHKNISLFHGAALSLQEEAYTFHYRLLLSDLSFYQNPSAYFATCFSSPFYQYKLHHHELLGERWTPESLSKNATLKLESNIVIIGGSGAIGHLLAGDLVNRHRCQIFITGRKPLSESLALSLKKIGVKAYFQVDADDANLMHNTFEYIEKTYGKIKTVFHLAGVLNDQLFINQTSEHFLKTIRPKVIGAEVLETLVQTFNVTRVILFSSLSGLVGNTGQSDYAAANAALRSFAEKNNALKTSTTWFAIHWGLWKTDEGMQMLYANQLQAMDSVFALEALYHLIAKQITISAIYSGTVVLSPSDKIVKPSFKQSNLTLSQVQAWTCNVIVKFTQLSDVEPDDALLNLGVDSIIATHIATHIQTILNQHEASIRIPKTLIFQYGTIATLAKHLFEQYASILQMEIAPQLLNEMRSSSIDDLTSKQLISTHEEIDLNLEQHIAIIGMAGEFPGADNIAELWDLLEKGTSSIESIPESRWDWKSEHSENDVISDFRLCRHGGFIKQAKMFDERYFNIAPVDAEKMDPQARRLLHQTYFALEDAGFFKNPHHDVGVFCSAMYNHYQNLQAEHTLIDSSSAAIANHISYAFDFKGPSFCVDSMCSGGLTALHLAINSLRLSECQTAVVGGVNIMPQKGKYRFLSDAQFLSPTGKCHAFGIAADGYVPGEGVVSLILKPLKLALAENDKIYGIIRASYINTIGKGSAFTVPSAKAQASVIQTAFEKSGLKPNQVSYIEAHGTGTALGDPIEIEGLNKAFHHHTTPIAIGSLKSNIGHLEAAAGLASIVKVLLQMHYKMLVPTLNCQIENPLLALSEGPFVLQKTLTPWVSTTNTRYAGISSFGAGGSNAHIILESAPQTHQRKVISSPKSPFQEKPFWADLGASVPAKKQIHHTLQEKPMIDAIYLKEEWKTSIPSFLSADTKVMVYLCTHTQVAYLQQAKVHYCVWNEGFSLDEYLKPESSVQLINLSAWDIHFSNEEYTQQQFWLGKYLSQTKARIHYVYSLATTHSGERKAYSAFYRTLSIEKPNLFTTIVETNLSFNEAIEWMSQHPLQDEKSYVHYQQKNEYWLEKTFSEENTWTPQKTLLKQGGVYLIVGGLGAVGSIIAKTLLHDYQAKIILIGRSPLIQKKDTLLTLFQNHPFAEYRQTDITNYEEVQQCIAYILRQYAKLDGVIHSACVLKDGLMSEKSFESFQEVIKSKILGTQHLDEATKHIALDCFILFSSMSSVFGNVGQADYCLGNAFLDYFAQHRAQQVQEKQRFGKTISINWPIWEVEGLNISQSTVDFICQETGILPLSEHKGATLFKYLMHENTPTQIVPLVGKNEVIRKKITHPPKKNVLASSLNKRSILDALKGMIAHITKTSLSDLEDKTGINELGFTSLLLSDLAEMIDKTYEITMAPSAFFTYNTIDKIADYLIEKEIQPSVSSVNHQNEVASQAFESLDEYAIIGMDGMLPGGPDLDAFWQSLLDKKSMVEKMKRWQGEYYAAALPDIQCFDNTFFGLSNREAMLMDPQHRLFLQVAYNTLLNGGYPPSTLKKVGVFVGVQFNDYQHLLQQHQQTKHPYAATGNSHAMLANRVSYLFDYEGPSQTIDTACSSTFVAIIRGIAALKQGECDAVLAGAVSLHIDPAVTDAAQSMGVLSPQYRCASFDESADGYVRGEGVGCFLIKRLNDAIRDQDAIHAVIKGYAENHGGRAHSLTAPNPLAQKALLLKAYNQDLSARVTYIETHGTGTKLGDPIEIDALNQAFKTLCPMRQPKSIVLGAVKSNVGHLEPAAGVPSLVKTIYAFKHRIIPANLHFKQLNPYIKLNEGPFTIAKETQVWQSNGPRVAGISSFGFGGSNTHLVLMEPPPHNAPSEKGPFIFTLSAKSQGSLTQNRLQLAAFLQKENRNYPLKPLSYTLNCCRESFKYRMGFIANNLQEVIQQLVNPMPPSTILNDGTHELERALAQYLEGITIDWSLFYGPLYHQKIHLPGYVFQSKALWFDTVVHKEPELEY